MKSSGRLFHAALSYLNFIPLWIVVLFIDVRSIRKGGCVGTEYLSVVAISLGIVLSLIAVAVGLRRKEKPGEEYELVCFEERRTVSAEMLLAYVMPLMAFDFTVWEGVAQFLIFFSVVFWLSFRHRAAFEGVFLELLNYRCYSCKVKLLKQGKSDDGQLSEYCVLIRTPLNGLVGTKLKQVNKINKDVMICQKCI